MTSKNPVLVASEEAFFSQNFHEFTLTSTSSNLEDPHVQDTLWRSPSTQGALPNPPLGIPDPSSLQFQIAAIWTAPPPPQPQTPTFLPHNWDRIPQRVYDYGQKQWDFTPSESIYFGIGGYPGFNMRDALQEHFTGLNLRDELALRDAPGAITFRFSVRFS